jgi:DNA invertase Pin-like site-specific DNA recombinase
MYGHSYTRSTRVCSTQLYKSSRVSTMTSSTYQSRFEQHIEALRQYVAEHGTCDVPHSYVHSKGGGTSIALGRWVAYVRGRFRSGRVPQDRAAALQAIPGWTWEARKPGPPAKTDRNAEIRRLRDSGISLETIAMNYGLSKQRIHQICGPLNKERT